MGRDGAWNDEGSRSVAPLGHGLECHVDLSSNPMHGHVCRGRSSARKQKGGKRGEEKDGNE